MSPPQVSIDSDSMREGSCCGWYDAVSTQLGPAPKTHLAVDVLNCERAGLRGPSAVPSLDAAGELRPKNAAILCLSLPLAMLDCCAAALLCYALSGCMVWPVFASCCSSLYAISPVGPEPFWSGDKFSCRLPLEACFAVSTAEPAGLRATAPTVCAAYTKAAGPAGCYPCASRIGTRGEVSRTDPPLQLAAQTWHAGARKDS